MFAEKLRLVAERVADIFTTLVTFLPALLVAVAVLVAGWFLARLLRYGVLRGLAFASGKKGFGILPSSGQNLRMPPGEFAGLFVFWTVLLLAVILAFEVMGLSVGAGIMERLLGTVPSIFVALIIFFFGLLLALVVEGVARGILERMGQPHPMLWAKALRWITLAVVSLLAIEQLGLAAQFALWLVLIPVGAVATAFALAFGLGCQDMARDLVIEFFRKEETAHPSGK
ncbi:MAG: mechanosensitive ion channel family protein [Limisphaerales bacterium]